MLINFGEKTDDDSLKQVIQETLLGHHVKSEWLQEKLKKYAGL